MTSLLVHGGALAAGALGVAAVAVAGPAAPAAAHAQVTGSAPADGAVVATPPAEVSLMLDAKPATVEGDPLQVYGPGGRRVDAGGTAASADARTLTVALDLTRGLPAGEYQLMYRVVSADTHLITGRLTFTAEQAAAPAGAAVPAAAGEGVATVDALQAGDVAAGPADDAIPEADQSPSGPAADDARLAPGRRDDARPRVAAGAIAALALVGILWRVLRFRRRSRRRFEAELAPPPLPPRRRPEVRPRSGHTGVAGAGAGGPPGRPASRPVTAPLAWVAERQAAAARTGGGRRRGHGRAAGAPQRRRAAR